MVAVQAMHWMEPASTLAEVARILRPGGVFATVDADWPPVTGLAAAEAAWVRLHAHIRVFEARLWPAGATGAELRRPIDDDDPALVDDDPRDPHLNRVMPGGRSWPKREHLANIQRSGWFGYCRELVFDEPADGGAERFVALLRSQGSYQGLDQGRAHRRRPRRAGVRDRGRGRLPRRGGDVAHVVLLARPPRAPAALSAQDPRKRSTSARNRGHAGSVASIRWLSPSSDTNRLPGTSEASSRPSSSGGMRSPRTCTTSVGQRHAPRGVGHVDVARSHAGTGRR